MQIGCVGGAGRGVWTTTGRGLTTLGGGGAGSFSIFGGNGIEG